MLVDFGVFYLRVYLGEVFIYLKTFVVNNFLSSLIILTYDNARIYFSNIIIIIIDFTILGWGAKGDMFSSFSLVCGRTGWCHGKSRRPCILGDEHVEVLLNLARAWKG